MKKIAVTLILLSLTGMALFAEGSQEETTWEPGSGYMGRGYATENQMPMRGGMSSNQGSWGPAGMGYADQNFNAESITLSGKIDLTDVNLPKLTVGENTYELMVPYRMDYDIDINNGDEITITGFEVPGYRKSTDSNLSNLMVTGATFEGKEYNLDMLNNGPMGYNRGPDMMNNNGSAYGQRGRSARFNNCGFQNNSRNRGSQMNNMARRPFGKR